MRSIPFLAAVSALTLAALVPTPAQACGGTFCDGPTPQQPTPMPVEQTGENILFVVDGTHVEAHVQIQYSGNPNRFAWVVPVPRVPEIKAGSQPLFTNLLGATVPTFATQQSFATCNGSSRADSGGVGCGSSDVAEDASFSGGNFPGASEGQPSPPDNGAVIAQKPVGAYDTTTLGNVSAEKLIEWLKTNNFQVPDATAKLLADYVAQNYVFVAVRLTPGTSVDEIHPLVFRYEGNEPCVPLKLTAVAAKENMGVRAFFLADTRFAPLKYKHVVLNDLLFNWADVASNSNTSTPKPIAYEKLVGQAVDSPIAMGRAFVTEYAGTSSIVSTQNISNPNWRSAPFVTAKTRGDAITELKSQGLLTCTFQDCTSTNPLLLPLLHQFIPLPPGETDLYYSTCDSCQVDSPDKPWDPVSFASELDERILAPGRRALDALQRYGYLTRMFTTISPSEMTVDPEFVDTHEALKSTSQTDVASGRVATRQLQCDNISQLTTVGTRQVAPTKTPAVWPSFPEMPAAERIEEYQESGAKVVLVDNTRAIDDQLAAYNTSQNWPPAPEFVVDNSGDCALDPGPVRGSVTARAGLVLLATALLGRRTLRARRRTA